MLTAVRRTLNAATRFPIVRAPTLAVIGALTRLSARLLHGLDSVVAVYARGSYGRGDFRPFISDIDFAIAVRRPPGPGYDACRALNRRLRLVRVLNPFVRDVWQTIVTEPQWPLVARYGCLFGTDDWRLIAGEEPWAATAPVDQRLWLAAWWNRQHFWTSTAVRQALRGQTSLRALEASLKKARSFGNRISDRIAPGPLALHSALWELDRSAARLVHDLELSPSPVRIPPEWPGPAAPTARERRALLAIGAAFDLERDAITVIGTEGFLVLVTEREWTAEEYRMGFEALARVYRTTGMLAFLCSQRSFAMAPLTRRLRILRAGNSITGAAVPAEPLLLWEQLLYQSLYLGTHLWVAAGRSNPGKGLERHVADALQACGFFLTGELRRDPPGVREALAEVESLDQELSGRLHRVPGLHRCLSAGSEPEPAELFELGTMVTERLAEILAGLDVGSGHVRVAAAS